MASELPPSVHRKTGSCPVCGQVLEQRCIRVTNQHAYEYCCPECGEFALSHQALTNFKRAAAADAILALRLRHALCWMPRDGSHPPLSADHVDRGWKRIKLPYRNLGCWALSKHAGSRA